MPETTNYTLGTLADLGCEMQNLTRAGALLKAHAKGIDGKPCRGCKRKMVAVLHVGDGNSFNAARAALPMLRSTDQHLCDACDPETQRVRELWKRAHPPIDPAVGGYNERLLKWLYGGDTGLSSRALLAKLADRQYITESRRVYHPLDPDDLGRCIRMLDALPELRVRLTEAASLSPEWSALIGDWARIEALYREEFSSGRAPKCYAAMKELLDGVEDVVAS